jgi:type VI secretion system protein VasJ
MELLDIGKTPIPGPNPAGRDIRTDPLYDKLSSEISKSSSISVSSPLDWKKVVDISEQILKEHSKDILVSSYLCIGLLKTEGLKGLANGFHVYRDLLETYWDTMFPPKARIRGRMNALDWLIDTLDGSLTGMDAEIWQQEDIDSLSDDLNAIDAFLGDNLDEPPEMRSVISSVMSLLNTAPSNIEESKTESAGEAKAKAGTPAPAAGSAQQSVIPVPDIIAGDDTDKIMRQIFDAMKKISNVLMEQKPLPPLCFRINRFIAWSTVESVPPGDKEGKTMLPPPDEQIQNILKGFYNTGNWQELLYAAETKVQEFLFWIDLSRYVSEALGHLNQKTVAKEITDETALYVRRLKGIEKLSFSDGTPFADEVTCGWLENIIQDDNASRGKTGDAASSGFDEQIKKETDEAEMLANGGDIPEALRMLHDKIGSASSERERFIREIWFCRFLFKINQIRLSKPYFRELLSSIETYKVEAWDPSLAIDAYQTILSGLRRQKIEGEELLMEETIKKLSLIDPVGALAFVI